MKPVLLRADSAPVQASMGLSSLKISLPGRESVTGIFFSKKNNMNSPRSSLYMEIKDKKNKVSRSTTQLAFSETELISSMKEVFGRFSRLGGAGSRSLPAKIPEVEENEFDSFGTWPGSGIFPDQLEFSGDGAGNGRKLGGGVGGGGVGDRPGDFTGVSADQSKIDAQYQEMLKANPGNPLLLRNYGKFLHEVEKDMVRAEEYYGRAILASPGDGEVLSLYGKLIWETQRDGDRAQTYFNQAVEASPDNCFVLGSYAEFLWDSEEDNEKMET